MSPNAVTPLSSPFRGVQVQEQAEFTPLANKCGNSGCHKEIFACYTGNTPGWHDLCNGDNQKSSNPRAHTSETSRGNISMPV